MRSVFVDTDFNKRGQTSRPFVGTEIQTGCNFEASVRNRYCILGCVYCLFNDSVLFGFPEYKVMVRNFSYITVPSNLDLQLHKDFHQPPPSSKSTSRPSAATEPNKSTEHRTIPKGSVHRTVVAVHVSRLLSTVCDIGDLSYSC